MRQITLTDLEAIVNLASKYGIESEQTKIYYINEYEYAFLVKLKLNTSAYEFIAFQNKLSNLLGDEGEEIDVVTEAILEKRVHQFSITIDEKNRLLNEAIILSDLFRDLTSALGCESIVKKY